MSFKVTLEDLTRAQLQVNNMAVEAAIQSIHYMLREKGYTYKASKQSALYTREYTKAGRRICIDGWHGTGTRGTSRHYGDAKSIFSLYDSNTPGYKPVLNAESAGDTTEELIKAQAKIAFDIINWIRNNA